MMESVKNLTAKFSEADSGLFKIAQNLNSLFLVQMKILLASVSKCPVYLFINRLPCWYFVTLLGLINSHPMDNLVGTAVPPLLSPFSGA